MKIGRISLWIGSLALVGWGIAVAQQSTSSLASLPLRPPLKQTITYFGVESKSDFRGPGMGQHLQYFPAFGLTSPALNLSTDCDGCIESTPDFENFKHHLTADFPDRTFSPDAGGDPVGVKTAGGYANWSIFTLPDGTTGRSGTTYDTHACDNSSNFVNQIRINTGSLENFCLNLITDNTAGTFDPNVILEARSDEASFSLEGHPDFTFDGQPDMYTFRYMGMKEGDRIKIRIKDSGGSCPGAGIAGIMVSHISTCTPAPGTCTPNCEDKVCGDDGCGGSCGICPRVDKLTDRVGYVSVFRNAGGTVVDPDVETVVNVGDSLRALVDDLESSAKDALRGELVDALEGFNLNVRNHRFKMNRRATLTLVAQTNGSYAFTIQIYELVTKFKIKFEGAADDGSEWKIKVRLAGATLTGLYNPTSGVVSNAAASIPSAPFVDVDSGNNGGGLVGGVYAVFNGLGDVLSDIFGLGGSIENLIERFLAGYLDQAIRDEIGALGDIANELALPALGLVPVQVQIAGIDYAPQIRNLIANPPAGQEIVVDFDASAPVVVSGNSAVVVTQDAALTLNVVGQFQITASQRTIEFPPIDGEIDLPYIDGSGNYLVEGWTCGKGLGQSLEAGVFENGSAVRIGNADRAADMSVANACGTVGTYQNYRYSIAPLRPELAEVDVWSDRVSVISGLMGFEKTLGEVSRAGVGLWMAANAIPNANVYNDQGFEFVGDFNGDGRQDLLWSTDAGWRVALANFGGTAFLPPTIWLGNNLGYANRNSGSQFVADFNGDLRDDYMWYVDGAWRVALANSMGNGFLAPTIWLGNVSGIANRNEGSHDVGDFNGDGRTDYVWYDNGSWWVALASPSGTGFNAPTAWLSSSGGGALWSPNPSKELFDDFNGDGRDDYMWFIPQYGWRVALANATGTGFNAPQVWRANDLGFEVHNNGSQFVTDLNGDFKADFMWFRNGSWRVLLSNWSGTGFGAPIVWLSDKPGLQASNPGNHFVGDMNGDGRSDFVWFRDGKWRVALTNPTGTGALAPVVWLRDMPGIPASNPGSQHIGDFNFDGRADLLWFRNGWRVGRTLLPLPPPAGPSC